MTFKLSPSSLGIMQECPRCFWLIQHKQWKRPSGAFPTLPSGMDRVLKEHFDRFRSKGELPPELCTNGHCDGLKLFDNEELLKLWRNNLKGIRYEDEHGNVLFGAVDNILVNGNKLIVLDYKTRGFALKEDTADHYQRQLDLYNFLLRKNGYDTEDYAFLLFYVPKEVLENGSVLFDTHLVKRPIDLAQAEELFQEALQLLNTECPENHCEWCKNIAIQEAIPVNSVKSYKRL